MRLMMDAKRKDAYLAALRSNGGNRTAAAAAVAPHSQASGASKPGYSSIRSAAERDPEFAAQIEEVLEHVRDDVYAEIFDRAMNGNPATPVYQKGERVMDTDEAGKSIKAAIRHFDNKLLLRLAARLDPRWHEKRTVTHGGTVTHRAGLSMADIRALSPGERDKVEAAFSILQGVRNEPAQIEHNPGQVIEDAEFEEIDGGDTMAELEAVEREDAQ